MDEYRIFLVEFNLIVTTKSPAGTPLQCRERNATKQPPYAKPFRRQDLNKWKSIACSCVQADRWRCPAHG